jgi:NlpC/P60 family putative phage cell wall peptidase
MRVKAGISVGDTGNHAVVAVARGWIGTPYVHQASEKGAGTDCLGLLRGVWRELVGKEPMPIPPYSADWAEVCGTETLFGAARSCLTETVSGPFEAGDVLLFRMRYDAIAKHIGIVALTGAAPTFVHAFTGHGVVESPLSVPWARRIAGRFRFPV